MRNDIFTGAIALILVGVLGRLVPHLPNATPLAAIALTGSLFLGWRWGVALPLVVLAMTDLVIGAYDWRIMASVYISFSLIGIMSSLVSRYKNLAPVVLFPITAPLLFFFVTNSAVWLFSPWYEKTFAGLLLALELGLPFLRNMFLGDIVYVPLCIGAFALASTLSKTRTGTQSA